MLVSAAILFLDKDFGLRQGLQGILASAEQKIFGNVYAWYFQVNNMQSKCGDFHAKEYNNDTSTAHFSFFRQA